MKKWKILSQKKVYKAKLFEVKELKIKLPSGATRIHQVAERRPTVTVLPLTDYYEVYLVSQYRYMLSATSLEAMAGFIEKGETALSAAKREMKEEMGISANQLEEIARIQMAASVFKAVAHIFLAKDLEVGSSEPDEDENITLVKIPLSEAVGKVARGEISHAASVIGILLLDKLRSENKL